MSFSLNWCGALGESLGARGASRAAMSIEQERALVEPGMWVTRRPALCVLLAALSLKCTRFGRMTFAFFTPRFFAL
jgi:hypothetical protein